MNHRTEYTKKSEPEHKISTDQKLELIRTVRMQQQYNRNQCREREKILYGISGARGELFASENSITFSSPYMKMDTEALPSKKSYSLSGFRLRFLFAMLLFGCFIFADAKEVGILGKNTEEILVLLQNSLDLLSKIPAWNSIDL